MLGDHDWKAWTGRTQTVSDWIARSRVSAWHATLDHKAKLACRMSSYDSSSLRGRISPQTPVLAKTARMNEFLAAPRRFPGNEVLYT
jgi:hypothetical protein